MLWKKAGEDIYIGTKYENIAGAENYGAKAEVGNRGYEDYTGKIREEVYNTEGNTVLSIGAQAYFGVGATFSVGFDVINFFEYIEKRWSKWK